MRHVTSIGFFALAIFTTLALLAASSNAQEAAKSGRIILYEHSDFSEKDRVRELDLEDYSENSVHSLHAIDFKDCLSSLKWRLPKGVTVVFYEHVDGTGKQYPIEGRGEDRHTHRNGFGDKASSWKWYR